MNAFTGEFLGTMLLLLLGNGVVANAVLSKTKGNGGGWIVITFGWAMAVFVGVFTVAEVSGAHINPAVTIALAAAGKFSWMNVPEYILAQFLGAMAGATLVFLAYKDHFKATESKTLKRAVFCTAPEVHRPLNNFITEAIGTFVLVIGVLYMAAPETGLGAINALPVAFLVLGIGLSLGGPTGYAINPARDLGPRVMHALLPIPGKGDSNWKYSLIPVLGPIAGGLAAAGVFILL